MTATAAVAELDAMKKTASTGSKPLGTNALKDHIKKLRVDAAKTAALTAAPSRYYLPLYADSFLLLLQLSVNQPAPNPPILPPTPSPSLSPATSIQALPVASSENPPKKRRGTTYGGRAKSKKLRT
jgi:hypothetical protein